jgi:hypothetical protein
VVIKIIKAGTKESQSIGTPTPPKKSDHTGFPTPTLGSNPGPPRVIDVETAPGYWKVVPTAIETLIQELQTMPHTQLWNRVEVWVAYYLGFGSEKARDNLVRHNVVDAEWPRTLPWLAHPEVGDHILPTEAVWEVHRTTVEGGYGGWATLTIGDKTWDASSKTPWAAFAAVMLMAKRDSGFKPRLPKDDTVREA